MEMKTQRKITKQDETNLIKNGFERTSGETWIKNYSDYFCLVLNTYLPDDDKSSEDVSINFYLDNSEGYYLELIDETFNVGELFTDLMFLLESGLIKLES